MFEAEGLFKAARICLAEGELIKAHDLLVDARQCFAHDPEHEAYLTLVDYQLNLHDGRQSAASAITRLEALVEREPNLECAWQFLGEIYASHGRDQSAVHAYQRALQINPDNDKVSSLWHSIDGAERRLRSRIISPLADRLGELGLRP